MPSRAVLVVLAVKDPGLRSTLAAQLPLGNVDLITGQGIDDPALRRGIRRPAVLIVDEPTVAAMPPETLEALLCEPHWRQVIAITENLHPADPDCDTRLLRIARKGASAEIGALLPGLGAQDPA